MRCKLGMAVYLQIAILLRLPLCCFKCLKVSYSCSKHRKSTGRESTNTLQRHWRPLDFVTSVRTITVFPPVCSPCILCQKRKQWWGKAKRSATWAATLQIHHFQLVHIRNIQRVSVILETCLPAREPHALKGRSVWRTFPEFLSCACVWQPGLPLCPAVSPPSWELLWPNHTEGYHRENAKGPGWACCYVKWAS